LRRSCHVALGVRVTCVSLAYFLSAPRLQPPDRQATTEDRRPPRQDPVVIGGRARPHCPSAPPPIGPPDRPPSRASAHGTHVRARLPAHGRPRPPSPCPMHGVPAERRQ